MMIALMSDIHGNDTAFAAAIADARQQGADTFLITGDLVTDHPQGSAVLARARTLTPHVLCGNREKYCLRLSESGSRAQYQYRQFKPLFFTVGHLAADDFAYMRKLPDEIVLPLDTGLSLLAAHNSPGLSHPHLHPDFNDCDLGDVMKNLPHDILVLGHVHKPSVKRYGKKLFINPGSVGENYSGDFMADYALLSVDGDNVSCTLRHVPYDGAPLLSAIQNSGLLRDPDTAFWIRLVLRMQTAGRDLFTDLFAEAKKMKKEQDPGCPYIPDPVWLQVTELFTQRYLEPSG